MTHPHLTVRGDHGLYALLSRFTAKPCTVVPGVDHPHGLDLMTNLCETPTPPRDPDVSLCKLSLTRDERVRPRAHKGSFGHDFDPIM